MCGPTKQKSRISTIMIALARASLFSRKTSAASRSAPSCGTASSVPCIPSAICMSTAIALALRVANAGIEQRVADVGEQRPDHGRGSDDERHAEQHGIVARDGGVVVEQPHPRVVEDLLTDQRPSEDERQRDAGERDDRDERVAEDVAIRDALRRRTLRPGGADIVLQQILERRRPDVAAEERDRDEYDRR